MYEWHCDRCSSLLLHTSTLDCLELCQVAPGPVQIQNMFLRSAVLPPVASCLHVAACIWFTGYSLHLVHWLQPVYGSLATAGAWLDYLEHAPVKPTMTAASGRSGEGAGCNQAGLKSRGGALHSRQLLQVLNFTPFPIPPDHLGSWVVGFTGLQGLGPPLWPTGFRATTLA